MANVAHGPVVLALAEVHFFWVMGMMSDRVHSVSQIFWQIDVIIVTNSFPPYLSNSAGILSAPCW